MASTQQSRQAEQVASNAWLWADGGCICADAPHAGTSAAVIAHQIGMRRNTTPLPVTRSSRVSSRASGGFTTIVQRSSSPARSFMLLRRIRWSNRRPGPPEWCLQTGKRCFTNRGRLFGSATSHVVRSRRHMGEHRHERHGLGKPARAGPDRSANPRNGSGRIYSPGREGRWRTLTMSSLRSSRPSKSRPKGNKRDRTLPRYPIPLQQRLPNQGMFA